jgi:hypothetical protein
MHRPRPVIDADETETLKPLYTPSELAAFLNLEPQTIATWRMRGQGPPFIRVGSVIRYRRAEVESWLRSRSGTSTSQLKAAGVS